MSKTKLYTDAVDKVNLLDDRFKSVIMRRDAQRGTAGYHAVGIPQLEGKYFPAIKER